MKKESTKDLLLSYLKESEIYENDKIKVAGEKSDQGPSGPASPVNDPDKDADNPDSTDLFADHNSILFLTAPDESGIIKRGGNLGFLELTPSIIEEGEPIDLEDFQWWCNSDEFEKYLEKTGRSYNKDTGDWTSESEESEEEEIKSRKISSYSDFISEKKNNEGEKALNEINVFGATVGTNVTSKGMAYTESQAKFQKGKLTDSQRKFVKFYFTRNHLRNNNTLEKQLDIRKLEVGKAVEIFVSAYDPKTSKADETAMVAVRFVPTAVIKSQGDLSLPMVVGKITHLSPNLGQGGGGEFTSILQDVVKTVYSWWDNLESVLSTTSGWIFTSVAGIAALSSVGVFTAGSIGVLFNKFRVMQLTNSLLSTGKYGAGLEGIAAARADAKAAGWFARMRKGIKTGSAFKSISNFIKYPATVVKRWRNLRKWNKTGFLALKGWKAARYIAFGRKLRALGKTATYAARATRVGTSIAKWSNPIGWGLLLADVIGSTLNYTSDNQAPSWDPMIGGEGDAMKDYKSTICPSASNSFNPAEIPAGQTITLCWTQNPESGFAAALSFVVSNSTRTTMNITKIFDFKPKGQSKALSLFLINSVNYKDLWDNIKGFDLRFLFIKEDTFEEGYADDNIGAFFLGAKSQPDSEDGVLPLAYYGHCASEVYQATYQKMKDQLLYIPDDAPSEYNFHFEDSESNVINVFGSKVTDKDLEDAGEEEIRSYFDVQPVSSLIGNPDDETDEEREERESLEAAAKMNSEGGQETEEEESPEVIAKNEGEKWYSSIEYSKPITSFEDFKSIKESLLFENGDEEKEGEESSEKSTGNEPEAEEKEGEQINKNVTTVGEQVNTAKEFQKNFQNIIENIDEPIPFCIYFVTLREYANPELRDIYKPGSFMNFSISGEAISAPNDSNIEGEIQVNNLDILLDVKKGTYDFDRGDVETDIKDTDLRGSGEDGESTSSILTKDSGKVEISSPSSYVKNGTEIKNKEIESTISRMNPQDLSSLDISNWEDVTSVKVIRDDAGTIKTVKIKNRKAKIGDKSRRFDIGEPGFEQALILAKANKDRIEEEKEKEELLSKR